MISNSCISVFSDSNQHRIFASAGTSPAFFFNDQPYHYCMMVAKKTFFEKSTFQLSQRTPKSFLRSCIYYNRKRREEACVAAAGTSYFGSFFFTFSKEERRRGAAKLQNAQAILAICYPLPRSSKSNFAIASNKWESWVLYKYFRNQLGLERFMNFCKT